MLFRSCVRIDGSLHLRIKKAHGVASRFLGLVHRDVGLLHQFLDRRLAAAEQGRADAGRAVAFVPGKQVRQAQGNEYLFAYRFGLRPGFDRMIAQVFEYQHEFIAAQSGHGVAFAHTGRKPLRDLLQKQIADVVAERVVQRLEMIQVDEQQRALPPAARAGSDRMLQPVHEQTPVGQLGERVKERQILNLFFRLLALVMSTWEAT